MSDVIVAEAVGTGCGRSSLVGAVKVVPLLVDGSGVFSSVVTAVCAITGEAKEIQ
jgi:hypothetical protein